MNFSDVLNGLKEGRRFARHHWKNALFVFVVPGSRFEVNRAPLLGIFPAGTIVNYASHIDVVNKTEDGSISVSTWSPSMEDVRAEDWYEYGVETSGYIQHNEVSLTEEDKTRLQSTAMAGSVQYAAAEGNAVAASSAAPATSSPTTDGVASVEGPATEQAEANVAPAAEVQTAA